MEVINNMEVILNKEALKEVLRYAVLGAVAYAVQWLLNYYVTLPPTESTAVILAILRYLDKSLYDTKISKKGLTQF